MKLLISCILARTQRDFKVDICHHLWQGNHPHIVVILKDADLARRFYMEIQKKLTDAIKRLLGLEYLNIWAGTPRVIEIPDLESAIKMIAYYYANPAAAHLVESIEQYLGLSSWTDFGANMDKLSAVVVYEYPWIHLPTIPKLPRRSVSEIQDRHIVDILLSKNKKMHRLEIKPNAWMRFFNITTDKEAAAVNARILARLHHNEKVCQRWRERKGWRVLGGKALYEQPIMAPHTPKKHGRRIFCVAATKQLRIALIKEFKEFCAKCRECYRRWKLGDYLVQWPPGAFLPPLPPLANAVEFS